MWVATEVRTREAGGFDYTSQNGSKERNENRKKCIIAIIAGKRHLRT